MGDETNIGWTDKTGNPWTGCRRVSEGCANCYMFALLKRWGREGTDRRLSKGFWKDALRWEREAVAAGVRYRVFPSLCDWLDDEVPIEWLAQFLKLIHDTPHLDWLLLTKRPENFEPRLRALVKAIPLPRGFSEPSIPHLVALSWMGVGATHIQPGPPPNVWLGVSVENQKRADERIPKLLKIPAAVRFLSVEPLLEHIAFDEVFWRLPDPICSNCPLDADCDCGFKTAKENGHASIDWVIVGGESGGKRRDCSVAAIVGVACQCQAAGVPVFVKQDCALRSGQQDRIPEKIWKLKQFPKAV